jgi:hypothetical protein
MFRFAPSESVKPKVDYFRRNLPQALERESKECCGRTPMATLEDGKTIWKEKSMN